jgi:hypothetical protein
MEMGKYALAISIVKFVFAPLVAWLLPSPIKRKQDAKQGIVLPGKEEG